MEVFLDPNRDLAVDDPIIITQFNVSKAIKDSILVNFGECGLASSFGSFQGKYNMLLGYVIWFSCLVIAVSLRSIQMCGFLCSQVCESHYKAVYHQSIKGGVSKSLVCHYYG